MAIVLDGTAGITTPEIVSTGGPLVVNASAPDNSVVVNASGNVGIGTSSPSVGLSIQGTTADAATIQLKQNASGGQDYKITSRDDGSLRFNNDTAGAERMRIDSSGHLVQAAGRRIFSIGTFDNTTGAAANMGVNAGDGVFYRSTSSLKYKREVRDYDKGLASVMQLRPAYYKGTSDRDGETQYAGLIAEEVHEAGLTEFVQYADDKTPDALAYGHMVSLAFKAIQELKAINDAQAQTIESLTARVVALENQIV